MIGWWFLDVEARTFDGRSLNYECHIEGRLN